MIIDCHCHIASKTVLPPPFFDGWLRTVETRLPQDLDAAQVKRMADLLRELNEDPQCVKLIAEMEIAGIDLAVLLVIDFGIVYKDLAVTIEEVHLEHKRLMERSDRFIAFSGVDPRRGKEVGRSAVLRSAGGSLRVGPAVHPERSRGVNGELSKMEARTRIVAEAVRFRGDFPEKRHSSGILR